MAMPLRASVQVHDEPEEEEEEDHTPRKAGCLNFVNMLVLMVAATVTLLGKEGIVLGKSTKEVSELHPTLLSPQPLAYDIWFVVFGLELVFCVAQLTPCFCKNNLVYVVTPWWVLTCGFQTAYAVFLALDMQTFALGVIIPLLLSLLILVLRADTQEKPNFFEFWFIRMPFSLHTGCILALSMTQVCMVIRNGELPIAGELSKSMQVSIVINVMAACIAMTALFAMAVPRPDPVVCMTVAWFTYFMGEALVDPETPKPDYDSSVLTAFHYAALAMTFVALCFTALAFPLRLHQRFCRKEV